MGLYIPDLKLPDDGDFELWIAVRKDGSFTYNVRGGWQDGRQKAIPVPPHGDLFDITKVKITPSDDEDIAYEIDFGNTVIPAESFSNLSKPCKDDADFPICTKASPASLGIYKKAEEGE